MATSHAHKSQEYVLFIGNPGAGKSTLLNSILGETRFQSGLSYGGGLTKHLQWASRNDIIYGDTPGLADSEPNMRQQAAREIRESLKENGNYKVREANSNFSLVDIRVGYWLA
jgi:ribosome biogenesis GTPase A